MMSQRFILFYAGYSAQAPALYFSQLEFVQSQKITDNDSLLHYLSKITNNFNTLEAESHSNLKTAVSLAVQLDIEIQKPPRDSEEYFSWLAHYTECFENEFPMRRIDHYYFLFGRKIAEMQCNLGLLSIYIDITISTDQSLDLYAKMYKCIKDTEYILFKLMAAIALLSSEPRQNYFNVYYKLLCEKFQPFKGINVQDMEKRDLEGLIIITKEYEIIVTDGFKKCIELLKELGV